MGNGNEPENGSFLIEMRFYKRIILIIKIYISSLYYSKRYFYIIYEYDTLSESNFSAVILAASAISAS